MYKIDIFIFHDSRITAVLPVIYCANCENEFFECHNWLLFFFRSCLVRHGSKYPYEKQTDAEVQALRQRENSQKGKCKVYIYKLER